MCQGVQGTLTSKRGHVLRAHWYVVWVGVLEQSLEPLPLGAEPGRAPWGRGPVRAPASENRACVFAPSLDRVLVAAAGMSACVLCW